METKQFTLTKHITKHGNQAVLIIPSILQEQLRPGTLAEIRIEVIETNLN
jgi:antitoxin component of MazEF toxin-antitoxin module